MTLLQTAETRLGRLRNPTSSWSRNDEPLLGSVNRYSLGHVDLELLQAISLAVSQARTVDSVLKMIVDGLVGKAGLALARIWLMGPGDICATCPMGGAAEILGMAPHDSNLKNRRAAY